jgi:hypothetical protein
VTGGDVGDARLARVRLGRRLIAEASRAGEAWSIREAWLIESARLRVGKAGGTEHPARRP